MLEKCTLSSISWPPRIAYSERVCIVGPSGSGKSLLAKSLLRTKKNVLIIDSKHSEDWSDVGEYISTKELGAIRGGRWVWKASEEYVVEQDVQSDLFRALKNTGNRITYVDEAYDIIPGQGIKILATQGRGKKAGLWVATQRPSHVPLFLVSEANWYFIFHLRLDDDRKRMESVVGAKIPWDRLMTTRYSFFVYRDDGRCGGPFRLAI